MGCVTIFCLLQLMMPKTEVRDGVPVTEGLVFRFYGYWDIAHMFANRFTIWVVLGLFVVSGVLSYALYRKTSVYIELKQEANGGSATGGGGAGATKVAHTPLDRSIVAFVDASTAGKAGISPEQRASAAAMIVGLGFATEGEFAAVFRYVDFPQDLPGFPVRVKLELMRVLDLRRPSFA